MWGQKTENKGDVLYGWSLNKHTFSVKKDI